MTAIGTLKARIIEAALEEARTQEAYRKAWDEDEAPYNEPLKGKTLEACLVNLRALTALQEAGRALYAEMQTYCPRCNGHHARDGEAEEKCQLETQIARADHHRRGGTV